MPVVKETVNDAKDKVVDGYNYTTEKVSEGYDYTKEKANDVIDYFSGDSDSKESATKSKENNQKKEKKWVILFSSGWFLIYYLTAERRRAQRLYFVLRNTIRHKIEIKKELQILGISEKDIYPDLIGIGKSIQDSYTFWIA